MTAALLQQLRTTFLGDNERNHTWTGGMRAYRAFLEVLRGRFESRGTPTQTQETLLRTRAVEMRSAGGGGWEPTWRP